MPLHDWTGAAPGKYHDFHQSWTVALKRALNNGALPDGFEVFVKQRVNSREGDVLAIDLRSPDRPEDAGGVATAPRTRFAFRSDAAACGMRANRVVVRQGLEDIVAVIEILSPGNKDRARAAKDFVAKTAELVDAGIHVLVVDPFPPGKHDPTGMHAEIWDHLEGAGPTPRDTWPPVFAFPPGHDRLAASYCAGFPLEAFVETFAVGDALLATPLFIADTQHIPTPLEASYLDAWQDCPRSLRRQVEGVVG